MVNLFSPLEVKSVTIKNRLGISPMCQYMAVNGYPNDWHLVHLGSRAIGGAGLVMTEATAIDPNGRITPDCLGIWSDSHTDYLMRIAKFIQKFDAVPGIQLAHAGRKGSSESPFKGNGQSKRGRSKKVYLDEYNGGFQVCGPSPIAFESGAAIPHELTVPEIKELVKAFGMAANRARQACFKLVEIHAAHGYLLNSFYSPLTNKRTDIYGGSFENRVRFLVEVVEEVRRYWPTELPLSVRLSVTCHAKGGFTLDDAVELAKILKSLDVDLIDCSSGHVVKDQVLPSTDLKFQSQYAAVIKHRAQILTMAVGNIDTPAYANSLISENMADMALIARASIKDPYFAYNAAKILGRDNTRILPKNYTYAI